MGSQNDLSDKDSKYFIDNHTYNCPFCNRNNIPYSITSSECFSWNNDKDCYLYLVECSERGCEKISLHLSFYNLAVNHNGAFRFPPREVVDRKLIAILNDDETPVELDELFFHHQPTSFFTIDNRIPKNIREAFAESDNCLRNNYLTGASACLRKAIYKLLKQQQIPEKNETGDKTYSYDDRIDILKNKFKDLDSDFISCLKVIQGLTSQELHENEWRDFDNQTLKFLIETLREILHHIYVLPGERQKSRAKIIKLKKTAKLAKV